MKALDSIFNATEVGGQRGREGEDEGEPIAIHIKMPSRARNVAQLAEGYLALGLVVLSAERVWGKPQDKRSFDVLTSTVLAFGRLKYCSVPCSTQLSPQVNHTHQAPPGNHPT